ncbi:MAG TPA: sigma-70 family RNA polymerase sigma factor [Longimicrobiales bacterium]|nr:sigma-70 family RNA polymerase sigma factor [Longimicrobiales bacterium]
MDTPPTVTQLLALASSGDETALARAFPLVYGELRGLARRQLRRECEGFTLNSVALVHEAYLRLVDQTRVQWRDRAHFLAVAAMAMRRILIDEARRRRAVRHGGGAQRVPLDGIDVASPDDHADLLLDLDSALSRLSVLDSRQARVVECRFFGGLTEEETAAALGIGLRTVKRDWAKARSWLYQELYPEAVT